MPAPLGLATSISSTRSPTSRPECPRSSRSSRRCCPECPRRTRGPAKPRSQQKRVSWLCDTPASTRSAWPGRSSSRRQRESWITTPATGASSARLLKPPPITWCGTRARARRRSVAHSCARFAGETTASTGPPTRSDVSRASGDVEAHRRVRAIGQLRAQLAPDHRSSLPRAARRGSRPRLAMLPAPSVTTRSPARDLAHADARARRRGRARSTPRGDRGRGSPPRAATPRRRAACPRSRRRSR